MEAIVKFLADGTLIVLLIAGAASIALAWWKQPHKRQWLLTYAPQAIMAGLTSLLIAKLVSLWYQPSAVRPFIEQGLQAGAAYIDNPGFPSDHALLGTVVVVAVWFLTPYRKFAVVLALLLAAMCVGRVLALVHTPLDVVGGVAFGLVGAAWYLQGESARKKA